MGEFIKQKDGFLFDLSLLRKRYKDRLVEIINVYGVGGTFIINTKDMSSAMQEGAFIDMLLQLTPFHPIKIRLSEDKEVYVTFKNKDVTEDEILISLCPTETQAFLYRYVVDTLNQMGVDYQPTV